METFEFTRKTLASLLLSLRDNHHPTPTNVLEEAWRTKQIIINKQINVEAFHPTMLSPLLAKLTKFTPESAGLSINEIASLGNHLEFAMVTSTAIQNWVKRDVKELIGSPLHGKKYSIDQAAILFIVEDLKAILDFDSIRKVLTMIFNNPVDRSDDIIDPVHFYKCYSDIFNDLYKQDMSHELETTIKEKASEMILGLHIDNEHQEIVENILTISVLAIFSSCFQSKAKDYIKKL
ncbi:DUF1836 domain-containing protein [Bacillus sp. PS06]|uniref:DUF1836 domain-containing protein n=1 Tax=Bacillus sp. PS06 TaxID=2764176 RepID=UPI00177D3DEE|nr:DUF1836 domain-containing protein [Bacillus sp. PS06]MBD8067444.1 DUF1836 domain-containing protein [Bacillus sp. PS06]